VLGGPRSAGFPAFSFSRKVAFVFEPFAKSWANLAREPILPFEFPLRQGFRLESDPTVIKPR
jgi:hypothetical protein